LENPVTDSENIHKVTKTDEEWRQMLSAEEYQVTRHAGTERPFTGVYWKEERAGKYLCKCCDSELFDSDTKFDAGCGWPSFYAPLESDAVVNIEDNSLGMRRIEVLCAKCDAHLGHVFPDGPQPTGLRYCMNSASLNLQLSES
jgi:peptide-methionine (R)-S-oxide reductase